MITRKHKARLQDLLNTKFTDILHDNTKPAQLAKAFEDWENLCDRLGITRREHPDYEPGGQVFEDFIALDDPSPAGESLEISNETALKILTLGLP
jgi:hypothetical protein